MNPDLFKAVEAPSFSARLNVVSGYNQFVRGLASAPEFRGLLAQVRSEDDALEILFRAVDLLKAPYDPAYESPSDVAVAAYLSVLRATDPELAYLAADLALASPGYWWAWKVAGGLAAERKERAERHRATQAVPQQGPVGMKARHSADVGAVSFGGHGVVAAAWTGPTGRSWRFTALEMAPGGNLPRNRGSGNQQAPWGGKPPGRNRGSATKRQPFEAVA
jgi:hypothetical protein